MITVSGVSKSFGKKRVVSDLSFTVEPGKVTGFLGPNGSGKSTTMRLMLGLAHGDGQTLFDEKPLAAYAQPARIVGILLEAKAFHPTRTARNHLRVLAAAMGVPDSRVDEVLTIVGLHDVAHKRPGTFSLGMSQRLGIAAALLGQPKYLLLDEPANGLDPEGIHWLRQFLQEYAAAGNGVLVSSHLLSEMSQMADNLVVIGKGSLIRAGTVADLINTASHATVHVRSSNNKALQQLLAQEQQVTRVGDHLQIRGVTTDVVGQTAFDAGITILELSTQAASLEDAFLEITADVQEYAPQSSGVSS